MEIVFPYTKKRRDFGRHPSFQTCGPDLIIDMTPNPELQSGFGPVPLSDASVQCAPAQAEHEVNTERFSAASRGMWHKEGGWPKDIDPNEIDHLNMFRKKTERSPEFTTSVVRLTDQALSVMKQNDAIDIYQHYFDDVVPDRSQDISQPRCLLTLKDPNKVKRSANMISWHPDERGKIAVAYSVSQFQRQPPDMSPSSYIWDLENPTTPVSELVPLSPLCSLQFNYKDTHILVGGSYNGQLSFFDPRKGALPYESTPIERCHRDPVYKVQWIQCKSGMELASVSTDGRVLVWDLRKLGDSPFDAINLLNKLDGSLLGGISLDFDAALGPSKFMVGTEQGIALQCNRKAKTDPDKVSAPFGGHYGPVYSIQRNPFHSRYFLTISDWCARLWSDEVRTPMIQMPFENSYLTCGCWSPTRPSIFFASMRSGYMAIWDVLSQQKAVKDWKISDTGIVSMELHSSGALLSAGASDGSVAIYELCEGLSVPQATEKAATLSVFDREARREKNIEQRTKESQRKQGGAARDALPAAETSRRALSDSELQQLEEEFSAAVGRDEDNAPIPVEPESE